MKPPKFVGLEINLSDACTYSNKMLSIFRSETLRKNSPIGKLKQLFAQSLTQRAQQPVLLFNIQFIYKLRRSLA